MPLPEHYDPDNGKKSQGRDSVKGSRLLAAQLNSASGGSCAPMIKKETPGLPWIGKKRETLNMVYVGGDDPWNFCLGYHDVDDQRRNIEESIKIKHAEGLLKQCPPEVGKFVVCRSTAQNQPVYFRGFITKYNPKVRGGIKNVVAYKLDHGSTTPLFPADIYSLPADLAGIPCQVVKCRLLDGEHQMKEKFCDELKLVFRDVLKSSVLTVNLGQHDDSKPPCFSAVVWAFDASKFMVDVDLNRWITSRVIPRLKAIPLEDADVFMYLREREILDPYYDEVVAVCEQSGKPLLSNGVPIAMDGSHFLPASETDDVAAEEVPAAGALPYYHEEPPKDAYVSQATGESTLSLNDKKPALDSMYSPPADGETRVFARELAERVPVCLAKPRTKTPHSPFVAVDGVVNTGQACGVAWSHGLKHPNVKPATLGSTPATSTFEAEVVVTKGTDEGNVDSIVADLQEEYQPTDERRVCLFFQKRGFCSRKLCSREHIEKTKLWTTDVIATHDSIFNQLCLPDDGSEVCLKIQHLKSPVAFYVNLPDEFSDIGESNTLETAATLHADLNSLQSNNTHPLLQVGPQDTELIIAMGQQDSLGPRRKWLRARVVRSLDETHVEAFFLDFGNKVVVKTKDLRAIRPRFLHLPAQAVLTRLYKLVPIPGKEDVALQLLTTNIVQKELKAIVIDQHDEELDVLLFLENGDCLNDLLVRQNLAKMI